MTFKIGDQVVHVSHGSGQVVAIEEKRISGAQPRLFYAVETGNSTVWVPVDSDGASLRRVVSKSDLARCRTLLAGRPAPLNADRRQRYLEVSSRLRGGTFDVMCEVVRDLTAHGWPKPLSESDSAALHRVQENVAREWAAAVGVPVWEATQEITALLSEGRKAYSA